MNKWQDKFLLPHEFIQRIVHLPWLRWWMEVCCWKCEAASVLQINAHYTDPWPRDKKYKCKRCKSPSALTCNTISLLIMHKRSHCLEHQILCTRQLITLQGHAWALHIIIHPVGDHSVLNFGRAAYCLVLAKAYVQLLVCILFEKKSKADFRRNRVNRCTTRTREIVLRTHI